MITIDQDNNIFIPFDEERINKEFFYFLNNPGKQSGITTKNFIIKFFQQDIFYKNEKELCKDENILMKIINNRMQYLNKSLEELTSEDILQGFKRSGMFYGYGHFNPFWVKWFYEKYNVKTCYDPCGGWGHRLLGSMDLDLYIYNDLSTSTYNNVNEMINYFKLECITKTYNNDASNFIPEEDFEAMYTCPPYFNLEQYECGDFNDINAYNQFIDSLFNVFYNKQTCKIFGLVIREDFLEDKWKEKCTEKFYIKQQRCNHISKGGEHNKKEILYIFKK